MKKFFVFLLIITSVYISTLEPTRVLAVGQSCVICPNNYHINLSEKKCCKNGVLPECSQTTNPIDNCLPTGETCDKSDKFTGKCVSVAPTIITPAAGGKSGIKIDNYSIDNPVSKFNTVADIINNILPYVFTLSGITLFLLLIASGFEFLTSAGDEKKLQQAKGRITAAIAGFILIICAYWLVQIVEFLFHIKIF